MKLLCLGMKAATKGEKPLFVQILNDYGNELYGAHPTA